MTLLSGDEELAHAGPGAVLHARAGAARGVYAAQRSILVVVASPPPTAVDDGELTADFAAGTWR